MKKILMALLLLSFCTIQSSIAGEEIMSGFDRQVEYRTRFQEGTKMSDEVKKQEFERLLKTYNYGEPDISKIIQVISFDNMPSQYTPSFYTTLKKGYLKYNPTRFERVFDERNTPFYEDINYGLINDMFSNENANLIYIKIIEQLKSEYNMNDDNITNLVMNNNPIFNSIKDTNTSLKKMSEILDYMYGEGYKETDFRYMYEIYTTYEAINKNNGISNKKQAFNESLKKYIMTVNNFNQQQKIKENVSAPGLIFNTIFEDAYKR